MAKTTLKYEGDINRGVALMMLSALLFALAGTAVKFAAAPADKVNTWSYASVVIAAIIGYLVWGESLEASAILGIVLVMLGAHITSKEKIHRNFAELLK